MIRELLKRIHERGHYIGLHGSYNSYNKAEQIIKEYNTLRRICSEEGKWTFVPQGMLIDHEVHKKYLDQMVKDGYMQCEEGKYKARNKLLWAIRAYLTHEPVLRLQGASTTPQSV